MGIKGLKNIIRKHASSSLSEIKLEELKGSTIAIDSSILLYKYRYLYQDNYLFGFNKFINDLSNNNINMIFVFEGSIPDAKKETINKRVEIRNKLIEKVNTLQDSSEYIDDDYEELNELTNSVELSEKIEKIKKNIIIVTREHSNELMRMLTNKNIVNYRAVGEAEEYCAFLQYNGLADYVLTEDTDSLTFGAKKVLFNNKGTSYLSCNLEVVLNELKLNMDEFIDFCILCGCDYIPSIPKIGPVNALKIIQKYRNIDSFIKENEKYDIPDNFNYLLARELFIQNKKYQVPLTSNISITTKNTPLFIKN